MFDNYCLVCGVEEGLTETPDGLFKICEECYEEEIGWLERA